MRPREIKAALILAGKSQIAIAEVAEVSPGVVCNVIARRTRSAHVESAIARAIGMPRKEVFDDKEAA